MPDNDRIGAKKPRLASATIQTMVGNGASRAVGMASAVAIAALLGPAKFGEYALLSLTALVVGAFGLLGWGPISSREIAALGLSQARRVAGQVMIAVLVVVLAIGATSTVVMETLPLGVSSQFPLLRWPGLPIVAVWALGVSLSVATAAVLSGHRDFAIMNMMAFVRASAVGVSALAGALVWGAVLPVAIVTAAAEILVALVSLSILWRRGLVNLSIEEGRLDHLVRLWRPAVGAGAASIAILGATWCLQATLISQPGGAAENGGFSLALRLSLIVSFAPAALAVASVPYVSRQGVSRQAWRTAGVVIAMSLVLAAVAAAIMVAISPWICGWLGPKYVVFAGTVALMCLTSVLISLNAALGNVAVGLRHLRPWVRSDIILAASLVSVTFILVPRAAANGAVAAMAAAYGISCAYLGFALIRARLRFRDEGRGDKHDGIEID